MYSRRKRNYNIFLYTALIIAICALLAVLLWPEPVAVNEPSDNVNVNSETNAANKAQDEQNHNQLDVEDNDIAGDETDEKEDDNQLTETDTKSYYIVKNNGNVISVYFVTEDGTKIKLEDTDILYELLPLEDQNRFDTGIIIEDQEKLTTLLQDYES